MMAWSVKFKTKLFLGEKALEWHRLLPGSKARWLCKVWWMWCHSKTCGFLLSFSRSRTDYIPKLSTGKNTLGRIAWACVLCYGELHERMCVVCLCAVELQPHSITLGSTLLEHLLMSLNDTKKKLEWVYIVQVVHIPTTLLLFVLRCFLPLSSILKWCIILYQQGSWVLCHIYYTTGKVLHSRLAPNMLA